MASSIQALWGGADRVSVHDCGDCGFGFAVPYVAGDMAFYNLASGGNEHYPRDRWEFGRTIRALQALPGHLRLLEIGAGEGWFLRALKDTPHGARFDATALEYDGGALRRLREAGFHARPGAVTDLVPEKEAFDVICMFQTLEHLDSVQETFAAMRRLIGRDGHIFISAPEKASMEREARAAGFTEMAPRHIGRWNRSSFECIARRQALRILEYELEPPWSRLQQAWLLAGYRVLARSGRCGTLEEKAQAFRFRPLRGGFKRSLALRWLPAMWQAAAPVPPHNQWVHLRS